MNEEAAYLGTRPSVLRIESRANGDTRFRIETPTMPDAIVDLGPAAVAQLLRDLGTQEG